MSQRVLISRERIASRLEQMGRDIDRDYGFALEGAARAGPEGRLVVVPIMTGALMFLCDLIRCTRVQMQIRPVTIASYPGTATSSQGASIRGDIPTDLTGAHVLIVDDILDSGRTLGLLRRMIAAQRPASLKIAVLLRKTEDTGRREEHVEVEYVGFDIGDEFVIGYGLDYDGLYRNLPEIRVLEA
jgi:hypoxanthine phosphoribosyltransferase